MSGTIANSKYDILLIIVSFHPILYHKKFPCPQFDNLKIKFQTQNLFSLSVHMINQETHLYYHFFIVIFYIFYYNLKKIKIKIHLVIIKPLKTNLFVASTSNIQCGLSYAIHENIMCNYMLFLRI